jgi:hypothetical protein
MKTVQQIIEEAYKNEVLNKPYQVENTHYINEETNLVLGSPVKVANMKVGHKYFACYSNNRQYFHELFTLTGFSDAESKYGKSGPVFDNIKEVKSKYGLKTMKDFSEMDSRNGREYGQMIYMCGKWANGDEGCFYYPSGGAWSRGSGADRLTFYEAVVPTAEIV